MFQHTVANAKETRKLLSTINGALGERRLSENALDETFEMWWAKLKDSFNQIREMPSQALPKRSQTDLLEEILTLVRAQRNSLSQRLAEAVAQSFGQILTQKIVERLAPLGHDPQALKEVVAQKLDEGKYQEELRQKVYEQAVKSIDDMDLAVKVNEPTTSDAV